MNLDQLKKNLYYHVRLQPAACRLDERDYELPIIDDDWIIEAVAENGITIANSVTKRSILLGKDHIHHFTSNPSRDSAGIRYGFLILNVQVFVKAGEIWAWPNARPAEAVKPAKPKSEEIAEKWVDNRYPFDAGIQQKLETDGYRMAWCSDTNLTRKIELEGWEIVDELDARRVPTKFRIKDRPADLTLIKTKFPQIERTARRSSKRCTECGHEQYLGKRGTTTLDSEWLCPNESCPSKRRF